MKQLPRLVLVMDRLNRAIGALCRWLVLLMLALGGWNVIGRYLGLLVGRNLSSNSLLEGQWYLFAVIFLLGAGYTLQRNGHVRLDVLRNRWPARRQARMEVIGTLLFLLPFCMVMVITSLDTVAESWRIAEASPDPAGLPRYPAQNDHSAGISVADGPGGLRGDQELAPGISGCPPNPAAVGGEG